MKTEMFLSILVGLLLVVSAMQAFQLNNLSSGFMRMASITTGSGPAGGSALSAVTSVASSGSGDAEYEKMMDEMHPGWRNQQGAAPAQAGQQAAAPATGGNVIGQLNNLPNQVGGC